MITYLLLPQPDCLSVINRKGGNANPSWYKWHAMPSQTIVAIAINFNPPPDADSQALSCREKDAHGQATASTNPKPPWKGPTQILQEARLLLSSLPLSAQAEAVTLSGHSQEIFSGRFVVSCDLDCLDTFPIRAVTHQQSTLAPCTSQTIP